METCQLPPELTEDELSALIDGDADAQTREHILRCPYCAKRLQNAQKIEAGLSKALYRHNCPSSLELGQYELDLLDTPEQKIRIADHLKTCVLCRKDLRALSTEDNLDTPAATRDNILVMPQRRRRYIATMDMLDPAAGEIRGTQVERIIARADTTTIRLSFLALTEERVKLTIQLLSPDVEWRDGMVTIRQDERTVSVFHLNEYRIATCELPKTSAFSMRFVATDETVIEFNDVSP